MLISVVIPTYNRRDALALCLDSLLAQDAAPASFEIVVVVDGSTDGTLELLASPYYRDRVAVVEQPNRGQACAINAGARIAKGRLLLFLDDDLACDPHLVSSHLAAQGEEKALVVAGRMKHIRGPLPAGAAERATCRLLDAYYPRRLNGGPAKWPDDAWVGPNCSLSREGFLEAGGYDEDRFALRMGDVDLGLRLWKAGWKFRFEPQAVTRHRWVKTERQWRTAAEDDGVAIVRLCRRHPEYRAHALIPGILGSSRWKRLPARWLAAHPKISCIGLSVVRRLAEAIPAGGLGIRIADRLYAIEQSVSFLVGARREAGSWEMLVRTFGRRVPVLLYHHVGTPGPEPEDASLTVSPAQFDRHMRWLRARGYSGITASQWLAWLAEGAPVPAKAVIVTFDDGFTGFASHALPVLERNGFGAVQFVIAGLMKPGATWAGLPVMTKAEVVDCHRRGIEIGGHSLRHPNLVELAREKAVEEIAGARRDLEALGIPCSVFAYPYGFHDPAVREIARGEYKLAFTCDEGLNDLRTDPQSIRRTMVQPGDTLLDIELRASLGWSPVSDLRAYLRVGSRIRGALRRISKLVRPLAQPS